MNSKNPKRAIETLLVHAGERGAKPVGDPVATPLYATTTFTYASMSELDRAFSGESAGYVYTRFGNPTVGALEEAVSILEEGTGACAYASGMAALHAALIASGLKSGACVLASDQLYGATTALLHNFFKNFGVRVTAADFSDLDCLRELARDIRPQVLIAETISNPLLKICAIDKCAEIAHEVGARLIIDNTFASPYLCQPLTLGADIVMHSATKYLSGHGDATGGLVVTQDNKLLSALAGAKKLIGGVLGVWDAHEIMRGLKTLALRMERQCNNAAHLAERFAAHRRIARVHYPGRSAPQSERETMERVLRVELRGALVSIELRENTREAAFRFMDALQLCLRSTSLGDVFTGVLHPATASHRDLDVERRRQLGISDGLVRISVGIENVADIIADIEQALNVAAAAR
ncbi:MAG: PLP-dependent transferase [Pyrinomonadaceae bacterium]|nr:PLP-dependent transferase [Pyrinomonadaceae bacterium]